MLSLLILALSAPCPTAQQPASAPSPSASNVFQTTLTATDSKSIAEGTGTNWNDNRLRAYWNNATQGPVDGLLKFDLASIPDSASIFGMNLRLYLDDTATSPFGNPSLRVFRTDTDTWSRGATDPHPGLNGGLQWWFDTFPTTNLAPVDVPLDASPGVYAADLLDDTLSLVLQNGVGVYFSQYSFVYFHGANASPAPPELTVTWVDGPFLELANFVAGSTGQCVLHNGYPNGTGIIAWSLAPGPMQVNTPWGLFDVCLGPGINKLPPFPLNFSGAYAISTPLLPPNSAGWTIHAQALAIDPSNTSAKLSQPASITIL